jgi:hypothetical protein
MVSFIADGLPPEAQAALASLQQDVPPMAPSLAEQVVREQLGDDPHKLYLDWDPVPVAAASIGQVHKAVLHDGRQVAVKVQYPGVGKAIKSDLDNAEMLYAMFSAVALKGLDVHALVDELRARMYDELDYTLEAEAQRAFAEVFRSEGTRIVRTPVRAPKANAIAERFVRTVRAECLDWLLILNRRHLERVLRVYVDHSNRERPHRALEHRQPESDPRRERSPAGEIRRRDRLGGLIHEYYRAAA